MHDDSSELIDALRSTLREKLGWDDCEIKSVRTFQRVHSRFEEVEARSRDGSSINAFIKVYLPVVGLDAEDITRRILRDHEISTFLFHRVSGDPSLSVIKPLACFPRHRAIVTEKSPGQQFQEVLLKSARLFPGRDVLERLKDSCFTSGRWLRLFQEVTKPEKSELLDVNELYSNVSERLEWLAESPKVPLDQHIKRQTSSYFAEQVKALDDLRLEITGTHGDFFPGNVLVHNKKVTVLDFATFCYDAPLIDVTYFWHQLETLKLKPIFRPAVVGKLQEAFLSGYNPDLNKDDAFDRSHLIRLFRILHLVRRLVAMIPDPPGVPAYKKLYQRQTAKRAVAELRALSIRNN